MKLIHLSDIHLWRWEFLPHLLFGKRSVGMFSLLRGRARRFQRERLGEVVEKVRSLDADHVLITGDLTTTSLDGEFADARAGLAPLLMDPARVTILPGNHDRYTLASRHNRAFEFTFGEFAPSETYPWLRWLDSETAILGLDPTRPHYSARGKLPLMQLERAKVLLDVPQERPKRLVVACHYPLTAPPCYQHELASKRLVNAFDLQDWLVTLGPHLYCCGHVHAAWAFTPSQVPQQLCLNSGAPLLRDSTGLRSPGFLEIDLDGRRVSVTHHAWSGSEWFTVPMILSTDFFYDRLGLSAS